MKTLHCNENNIRMFDFDIRIELQLILACIEYGKFNSGSLCLHFAMATVATKRKLNTKSIKEKYAALKEVEQGSSKSQVAMKYGIPKNTLSTWIKNKNFSNL